eukprot:32997_5
MSPSHLFSFPMISYPFISSRRRASPFFPLPFPSPSLDGEKNRRLVKKVKERTH